MAKQSKDLRNAPDKSKDEPEYVGEEEYSRDEELCHDKELQTSLEKLYQDTDKAFEAQADRTNDILDYWDMYNCQLGNKQFYTGNSQLFLPLVHNAVNARKTRFVNQIFPSSQRNVECITEDGDTPHGTVSLMEHYIRKNRLRTNLLPPLVKNGDVEGQYTVYVRWQQNKRNVVYKRSKPVELEIMEGMFIEDPDDRVIDIIEEEVTHQYPTVEVISDANFVVFPATVDSIEEALDSGGGAAIIRRYSKAKINQMIEDGEIDKKAGKRLVDEMGDKSNEHQKRDVAKQQADSAGIRKDARGTFALVYEVWTKLSYKGEKRIYKCYLAGPDRFLSCKRNPWWSDKLPIISAPAEKVAGLFKGKPKIGAGVADLQIQANDAVNMGMDSAAYALLPIVMTDPQKNPRTGSMIMAMAAIWETNPNDTQFAHFPPLWKDAFEIIATAKAEIFQTLSVNPSAITQALGKKKSNQAEIAQEQQVDILTTADAVTVIEEGILTPLLQRWLELDHQYRDDALTVKQYGELGANVAMEKVPPIQFHRRWELRWFGVEAARTAAQVQQQIAFTNVLRGIPPNFYQGYELSLVPIIKQLVENTFGPRLAPLVFRDQRKQLSKSPILENLEMVSGEFVQPSPMDNHEEHMQQHMRAAQETGDPHKTIQVHIMLHQAALMQKQQQQLAQQQQQGQPGTPGGAGPGMPGQGGQAQGPNSGQQNPNGSIHPDQMAAAGAPGMPRAPG